MIGTITIGGHDPGEVEFEMSRMSSITTDESSAEVERIKTQLRTYRSGAGKTIGPVEILVHMSDLVVPSPRRVLNATHDEGNRATRRRRSRSRGRGVTR